MSIYQVVALSLVAVLLVSKVWRLVAGQPMPETPSATARQLRAGQLFLFLILIALGYFAHG